MGACMRWLRYAGGALAAALAMGCTPESTGVLGNGHFQYLCASNQGDPACSGSSSGYEVDLPQDAVAVGATFQIGYAPNSGSSSNVQGATGYEVVPASSALALSSGNTIVAEKPGYVALLARHAGNSDVDDFVHLRLSNIQTLDASPSSLSLSSGESQTVTLAAKDTLGAPLVGQLGCTWQVTSGNGVAALSGTPTTGLVSVKGVSGGGAVVHATCGTASVDVAVSVSGVTVGDGGTDG